MEEKFEYGTPITCHLGKGIVIKYRKDIASYLIERPDEERLWVREAYVCLEKANEE